MMGDKGAAAVKDTFSAFHFSQMSNRSWIDFINSLKFVYCRRNGEG